MSDWFDDMRKDMNKSFRRFFKDNWFDSEEDDFFSKNFVEDENEKENDEENDKDKKIDKKSKSYSISYHYATGMDEPVIKYSGDITENEVQNFVKKIQNQPLLDHAEPKSRKLLLNDQEPFVDVNELEDSINVVVELPGLKKEDIELNVTPKELEIKTNSKNTQSYRKNIELPTEINVDSIESSYNNGILEVSMKKLKSKEIKKKVKIK